MDNQENGARWIHCPICGSNTQTKVYDDTVLIKFPLYCPQCKKEILVNVFVSASQSPYGGCSSRRYHFSVFISFEIWIFNLFGTRNTYCLFDSFFQ